MTPQPLGRRTPVQGAREFNGRSGYPLDRATHRKPHERERKADPRIIPDPHPLDKHLGNLAAVAFSLQRHGFNQFAMLVGEAHEAIQQWVIDQYEEPPVAQECCERGYFGDGHECMKQPPNDAPGGQR